jgi:hypothetical protein
VTVTAFEVGTPPASFTMIAAVPGVAPAVTAKVAGPPGVDAVALAGLTVATAVLPLTAVNGPMLPVSLTVNVVLKPVPLSDSDAGDAKGTPATGVGDGDATGVVFTLPLHATKTVTNAAATYARNARPIKRRTRRQRSNQA